jgi:hypothetical protein
MFLRIAIYTLEPMSDFILQRVLNDLLIFELVCHLEQVVQYCLATPFGDILI